MLTTPRCICRSARSRMRSQSESWQPSAAISTPGAPSQSPPISTRTSDWKSSMIATLNGFAQQLVPVNGIKINAVTGGSGPPILLLHGWPETWWEWHKVMPLLAEHFSVVAMDLRGAGFSDCPQGGYDKATMAHDAHEVMSALGHQRYAVCGHDIGGMVALPQAAIYRDATTHLVVLDVPLPGWTEWEATVAK